MGLSCSSGVFKGTSRSGIPCVAIRITSIGPISCSRNVFLEYRTHVHDSGSKNPPREVVGPRYCLEIRPWSPFRCFRLALIWSDLPNPFRDFTKRNIPPGPVSVSNSVPIPRTPTATWVGIIRENGCWEGWRDFFDFLKNDILMETEKKETAKALNRGQLSLVGGLQDSSNP
jgi:hypothetical protein